MDYCKTNGERKFQLLDAEQKVYENSLVRNTPAEEWIDGHPLGNGDLGVMALGSPESFRFYLAKTNIWDDRTVADNGSVYTRESFEELKKIVKEGDAQEFNRINAQSMVDYSGTNYPSPQSCGVLSIKLSRPQYTHFSQMLDLYKGQDSIEWCDGDGTYQLHSFVHQNRSVAEFQLSFTDSQKNGAEISLQRTPSNLYQPEEHFQEGECTGFTFTFPDGLSYTNVMTVREAGAVGVSEGKIEVAMTEQCDIRILQTIVTSEESDNPRAEAIARLRACLAEDPGAAEAVGDKFWREFWNRSCINLESRGIEKIWYMGMYLIGSTSRKGSPAMPGLQGVWIEDYAPPWKGDYHTDLNIEMNYWPVFTANHMDLSEPFYRCYTEMVPKFEKDTRDYFKAEGIKLPISHDRKGNDLGGYVGGIFWQGSSAWIASLFWKNYLYSLDEAFLRETAFPFIYQCIRYYNSVLIKNEAGKYIIPLSWTPEEMESNQIEAVDANPAIDISHIKNLYGSFVRSLEILCSEFITETVLEQDLALARDILEHFTDYPREAGIDKEASEKDKAGKPYIKDSENCDFDYTHRHLSVLTPIYPSGEFNGYSSSVQDYQLALNTFYKYLGRGNTSKRMYFSGTYSWLACVAATLGLADFANQFLSDYLDSYTGENYLNNCFDYRKKSRGMHVGDTQEFSAGTDYQFAERIFQLETNTCAAEAINLLLLQSFNGGISVFPAYPWKDGSFDGLRAEGGFLVSSKMELGKITDLAIESLEGGLCTIYLDEKVVNVTVTDSGGSGTITHTKLVKNEMGNKVKFSFETQAENGYRCRVIY